MADRIRTLAARLIAWLVFRGPTEIKAGRRRMVFYPHNGLLLPVIAGASGEGEGDGEAEGGEGEADGETKTPPSDDASLEEWKAYARKWEQAKRQEPRSVRRRAKAAEKRAEEAEAKLRERKDADKSEQEKAIDQARKEAREEALTEAQKERRQDRLEAAVIRQAAKGIKVGEGDDAKTKRFADPDDALVHLERSIAKDEIDGDEIFDSEGKVQTEALTTALAELLERKPHLEASGNGAGREKPSGDADGGKGSGAGKGAEGMSVEEHLGAISRHKK